MEKENKSAIERVKIARDPDRPYTNDLLTTIFQEFTEIHGDRRYWDDAAIVGGIAKLDDQEVVVIGQQKGRDTNQRKFRNFGMPKPEGYRKALRLMQFAEKFGRPIITFIDTPGAYPGIDAEERGQAEAIASNLREMAILKVPVIVVVLGEGGSGGALAVGVGDRIIMLENAVYSVITPEGCAAILWKDASKSDKAAEVLRLTAENLLKLGLIDEIVKEPEEWKIKIENQNSLEKDEFELICSVLKEAILRNLSGLNKLSHSELRDLRYKKFRNMGEWVG